MRCIDPHIFFFIFFHLIRRDGCVVRVRSVRSDRTIAIMGNIKSRELARIGYLDNIARSLAVQLAARWCKHDSAETVLRTLEDIARNPQRYIDDVRWSKLARHFRPEEALAESFGLHRESLPFAIFGAGNIEPLAVEQMRMAMRLPISLGGALMADAHAGYGLPIGGVLATDHAVIPYAVGVDIGCRMSLTVFDADPDYLRRYRDQIVRAMLSETHFGLGIPATRHAEHGVLDRPEFGSTPLLRRLHGKAVAQLGTSGGGNHFVDFGEITLPEGNALGLPAGRYVGLLSHSGSRGVGADIAVHYSAVARETCKLPRQAGHFAWLSLDSEAGQEYWLGMNLAGDFARACHEVIHERLGRRLGLQPLANVNNHHNFAWREEIAPGRMAVVHRKGATPAAQGELGIIPGSMASEGFIVRGRGCATALCSASHGAGRSMSRQEARNTVSNHALRKMLAECDVTLLGGSPEEAPAAYKEIGSVMEAQQDLVYIEGVFVPRIVRMSHETV